MDIAALISAMKEGRSYDKLAADCGGTPTSARLQQIATKPVKAFPDVESIHGLAEGLHVSEVAVILSFAESLGLEIRQSGSSLEQLLPPAVEQMTDRQVSAVLSVVRAMLSPGERSEEVEPRDTAPTKTAADDAARDNVRHLGHANHDTWDGVERRKAADPKRPGKGKDRRSH